MTRALEIGGLVAVLLFTGGAGAAWLLAQAQTLWHRSRPDAALDREMTAHGGHKPMQRTWDSSRARTAEEVAEPRHEDDVRYRRLLRTRVVVDERLRKLQAQFGNTSDSHPKRKPRATKNLLSFPARTRKQA